MSDNKEQPKFTRTMGEVEHRGPMDDETLKEFGDIFTRINAMGDHFTDEDRERYAERQRQLAGSIVKPATSSDVLKRLEAMSPEELNKVLVDMATSFSLDSSEVNLEALKKLFEANGGQPIDFNDLGPLTTPEGLSKIQLQPIDHQAYPDSIRELEQSAQVTTGQQFAPTFNAQVARRHLYKALLIRMNKELKEGPLEGTLFVTGVGRDGNSNSVDSVRFVLDVKMMMDKAGNAVPSFKAINRSKAYKGYLAALRLKYAQEIIDAEQKVMERE